MANDDETNGGISVIEELQQIITHGTEQIEESAYRRLALTALLSVMKDTRRLRLNPCVQVGEMIEKHPKVSLFLLGVVLLVLFLPDLRLFLFTVLGIPTNIVQVVVTATPIP